MADMALLLGSKEKTDPLLDEAVNAQLPIMAPVLLALACPIPNMLPSLLRTRQALLRPALDPEKAARAQQVVPASATEEQRVRAVEVFAGVFAQSIDVDSPISPLALIAPEVEMMVDGSGLMDFGKVTRAEFAERWRRFEMEYPHRYTVLLGEPRVRLVGGDSFEAQVSMWTRFGTGHRYAKIEMLNALQIQAKPDAAPKLRQVRRMERFFVTQNENEARLSLYQMARLLFETLLPDSSALLPSFFEESHFYCGRARTRDQLKAEVAQGADFLRRGRIRILNGPELAKNGVWLLTGVFLGQAVEAIPEAGLLAGEKCLVLLSMDFDETWPLVRSVGFRKLDNLAGGGSRDAATSQGQPVPTAQ